MEIAEGIHLIKCPWRTYFVSSCLIVDESLTIIDAGTGASPEIAIYPYIRELGRKPSEISHILLTHAHLDHCAGVATMKRETGCMVGVHELGRPFLEKPELLFKQLRNRFPSLDDVAMEGFEPVKPDISFTDGDTINLNERELKIIHVPGHSPDSSCLVDEEQGVYICGDSIQGRGGRRPLIFHGSTAYRESMKKLLEEPFNVLVNGHPFPPFEKAVLRDNEPLQHIQESLRGIEDLRELVLNILEDAAEMIGLNEIFDRVDASSPITVGCILESLEKDGKVEKDIESDSWIKK